MPNLDHALRRPLTVGDVLVGNSRRFPDKMAVKDGPKSRTWAELNAVVNQYASVLRSRGLQKGDRLSVLAENRMEFLEASYVAAKAGLIFAPLNHRLAIPEVVAMIEQTGPKLLFHSDRYSESAKEIAASTATDIVCLDDPDFAAQINKADAAEPDVLVEPDDIRGITFTGGTTGRPKGVMLTHRNLMQMAYDANIEQRLLPSDRHLVIFPMGLLSGQTFACWYGYQAPTIVIIDHFEPELVFKTIEEERITTVLLAPTMVNALVNHATARRWDLKSLRLIFYGSSPIAVDLLESAMDLFQCDFMQGYGQTECTGFALYLPPEDHRRDIPDDIRRRRLRCTGREAFNMRTRLVDPSGNDVPDGEPGELLLRSEVVMAGYWNSPEETAAALRDGWLHTGDVFRRHPDGYLEMVDRAKDMIISGAYNVYSKEVELAIQEHEAVRDAAVIGIPHEFWGEAVHAVVVLHDGVSLSEDELIAFVKSRIASYKKPQSVEFVDKFPLTAAGKVHKPSLRAKFWNKETRHVH